MSRMVHAKGLNNFSGENNCFLNVGIQGLWHLESFRNLFITWKNHRHYAPSCVFCALKVIFTEYQFSDEARLSPDSLREALHIIFQKQDRFQKGSIDDAAEALEALLDCLHREASFSTRDDNDVHGTNCCLAHKVFGISTVEQIQCLDPNCGGASEPFPSTSFIYYTYVTALRNASTRNPGKPFDCLLKIINDDDVRSCPRENVCNKKARIQKYLLGTPQVFAIGLVWENPTPEQFEITQTLSLIPQTIKLSNVFVLPPTEKREHYLRGMVCYYGIHYNAYFYSELRRQWLVFDDATVKEVGSWDAVVSRCVQGRVHPSLLFYENTSVCGGVQHDIVFPQIKKAYTGFVPRKPVKATDQPVQQKSLPELKQIDPSVTPKHSVEDLLTSSASKGFPSHISMQLQKEKQLKAHAANRPHDSTTADALPLQQATSRPDQKTIGPGEITTAQPPSSASACINSPFKQTSPLLDISADPVHANGSKALGEQSMVSSVPPPTDSLQMKSCTFESSTSPNASITDSHSQDSEQVNSLLSAPTFAGPAQECSSNEAPITNHYPQFSSTFASQECFPQLSTPLPPVGLPPPCFEPVPFSLGKEPSSVEAAQHINHTVLLSKSPSVSQDSLELRLKRLRDPVPVPTPSVQQPSVDDFIVIPEQMYPQLTESLHSHSHSQDYESHGLGTLAQLLKNTSLGTRV